MKVPLFSPLAQNEPLTAALQAKFEQVLASGYFILGPEVESFEAETAEYLGASHAIGVSSGTDALLIALMALDIGPGDEVIVPSFTFFATAGVVTRLGATPVFADVCPACYQIQPSEVERLLTEKTRAVIPVHLFGHTADVAGIKQRVAQVAVQQKYQDIAVVEDVAQSMGAQAGGRMAGTIGDLGCYSFFPTKNLGGFGDGGLVTTEDAALADKVRRLRNHGMHPKYYHAEVGGNFRLDALQAALLRIKLPYVDTYLQGRKRNAERYLAGLSALDGVAVNSMVMCGVDCTCIGDDGADAWIGLPLTRAGQQPTWNQFTIRVKNGRRDELREFLIAAGIGAEIYYPVALHAQECFAGFRPDTELVNTGVLVDEVLSLPVYPELEPAQIDAVIGKITEWLG